MLKYIRGFILGVIVTFPLGINFGKDAPLLSNPFAAKPDIAARVIERTGTLMDETKAKIHEATKPETDKTDEETMEPKPTAAARRL